MTNRLVTAYESLDTSITGVDYHDFIAKGQHSSRLLADGHSQEAINSADNSLTLVLDSFSRLNLYLVRNLPQRCMELRAVLHFVKKKYEDMAGCLLTGYAAPTFCSQLRRNDLPPDNQRVFLLAV